MDPDNQPAALEEKRPCNGPEVKGVESGVTVGKVGKNLKKNNPTFGWLAG